MGTSANSSSIMNSVYLCASSAVGNAMFTAWFVSYLLLFPLFLFVLFIGITKWRNQRNGNTNSVNISHSDVFTFHMMALETLMTFSAVLFMYGLYTTAHKVAKVGITMLTLSMSGQTYFHCLTCGEHYLAVVHPITYLRLKKRGGVIIRNISVGIAWLLSFIYTLTHILTVVAVIPDILPQLLTSLLMVAMAIVPMTFCSISVLCVLIRAGPGEGGRNRKMIDQSKRSAFITIMAILGVLLVKMVPFFIFNCWFMSTGLDPCVFSMTMLWLSLPSTLVLPLLFLHRARKLPTC